MAVHSFSATQSEENSDPRFAQRLLERLPTVEAHAEGCLKKLQAPLLGRDAGRAISSHVKQILSWITAGMQRTMMDIPRVDTAILHLAKERMAFFLSLDPPAGLLRKPLVGVAAVEALLKKIEAKVEAKERLQHGNVQDLAILNDLFTWWNNGREGMSSQGMS